MSKLIDELKRDHQKIIEALNKVSTLGSFSVEGRSILATVKADLLAHLKKEDAQFYPVLHTAAKSDPSLQRTLDIFAKDMGEISKNALEFFDKWSKEGSDLEFSKDFGRLYTALNQRISREENIIYKKFDEIQH